MSLVASSLLVLMPPLLSNPFILSAFRILLLEGFFVAQTDKKFIQVVEGCIRLGKWVLVENVGEKLDAVLESLLLQQRFKQGGADMIKIGDLVMPYHESFR